MEYLKLMRINHYLKNILVFLPAIFSGLMFNAEVITKVVISFFSFSFVSSIIYIINDINDIEKDKMHPIKKNRPIASGSISKSKAIIFAFIIGILIILILYLNDLLFNKSTLILLLYLIINIIYSFGIKNIPLLDIFILAIGFVFRVLYGGLIINVEISNWLFLTVLSISFYMALGKRRNELIQNSSNSRSVLKYYNKNFLDKNMYMFLTLAIVFYSLWSTMAVDNEMFKFSIILVILILMKYSMNIENGGYGDPVDVITKDKILISLMAVYTIFTIVILYCW